MNYYLRPSLRSGLWRFAPTPSGTAYTTQRTDLLQASSLDFTKPSQYQYLTGQHYTLN